MQNEEAILKFIKKYQRPLITDGALVTSLLFVIADLCAIFSSIGAAFFIINAISIEVFNFRSFVTYWPYLPGFIFVFYILQLYPGLSLAPAEELRRYVIASGLCHAGVIISVYIVSEHQFTLYSGAFVLSWLVSIFSFVFFRAVTRFFFKRTYWFGIPAVIFGGGHTGQTIVKHLLRNPEIGYKPIAILDDRADLPPDFMGVPIFQGIHYGKLFSSKLGGLAAIVAMPSVERERLSHIIAESVREFKDYLLIPDFFGMTSCWMTARDINGIIALHAHQNLLYPFNRVLKYFLDYLMTIIGGILISPIILLIAICIKIDSPGPVFYGHHRLGRHGKPFKAWKFRSMVKNADAVLENLLATDPEARKEWDASFKLRKDPRVTRMGRFLRKTSLDELPQIWNVLRGEMSLIGPRPIVESEVPKYKDQYKLFSSIKPGMSGLWQVSGRNDIDYDERVALDVYYIESWSLWLDLHILFRTVGVILFRRGAY